MALNIPGYTFLRKINKLIKHVRNERRGLILTPSRRIARVAPPGERVVAMTFDDGPTRIATAPDVSNGAGLTEHLLTVLKEFGARGTFDVVGSTSENYPDASGELDTQYVFGKRYDHYAAFGLDDMAGALACPELVRRIDREGHELTNHTYRHIIYGKSRTMYSQRVTLGGLDEAVSDLTRLHELIYSLTKYEMRFTRPPHYVDNMPDGHTSFDACEAMGYHYLAASFDGGGYLPGSNGYDAAVEAMVAPLRTALEEDPSSLAGQIIFQKDGYNMSKQTPIASALRLHLELLEKYGYRVVTVSELLELSPFEDVRPANDCFEAVRELDRTGFVTGFRNNRFYPEREMTKSELPTVISPPVARGGTRPAAVKIEKNDAATARLIAARAAEVFEKTEGQPASNKRGDVAIWLHRLAVLNGIC
ncbi:MAG: polysaccharide deacetylase family protein [Oscillospiraceae bacterium]|jgi:peptidoglycan/xylan/chitin deacetylase (PgdA/CDA1 family)|nr:polysaccharide deacetylase family protein [Oscillospiraceae bacterium]